MKIHGIAASEGIAIAKAFILEQTTLDFKKYKASDPVKEFKALETAIHLSEQDIQTIREQAAQMIDEEHAQIFDAHMQILRDPEIISQIKTMLETDLVNAAYALYKVTEHFAHIFQSMNDPYMKERAVDVRDVRTRIASHLQNVPLLDLSTINEEVIVIANELTPSETAQLNREFVLGFVTNIGGPSSHSAIMARSLALPAVLGTKHILDHVAHGDTVIVDGLHGDVIINPSKDELHKYKQMKKDQQEQEDKYLSFVDQSTITKDHHQVKLTANIGNVDDVKNALEHGAEGVGLFRTEFLYFNKVKRPTEEEQYTAYKKVLQQMQNKKVIIRTLDIGGDKELSYIDLPTEANPVLGHRALRLCLEETTLFKTQLRALLRASIHGDLHIMFPMVATINELRDAKALIEEVKKELEKKKQPFGDYKIGIMVEIPSVAILADVFAKEVDFFSIGTNDLIQYTFAADRKNEKVGYLYQPYNPSLLRLIKMVIDAGKKEGIWTSLCGEMAGDQKGALLLLGLGLDEFSMSPTSILTIRELFSRVDYKELKQALLKVIDFDSEETVLKEIQNILI